MHFLKESQNWESQQIQDEFALITCTRVEPGDDSVYEAVVNVSDEEQDDKLLSKEMSKPILQCP